MVTTPKTSPRRSSATRLSDGSVLLKARFTGVCGDPTCHRPIRKGNYIRWWPTRRIGEHAEHSGVQGPVKLAAPHKTNRGPASRERHRDKTMNKAAEGRAGPTWTTTCDQDGVTVHTLQYHHATAGDQADEPTGTGQASPEPARSS